MFGQVMEKAMSLSQRYFLPVWGLTLIVGVFSALAASVQNLSLIFALINLVIFAIVFPIALVMLDKEIPLNEARKELDKNLVVKVFLLNILLYILLVIGFTLFILPGLVIAFFTALAPYILVLERKGVIQSLKESFSQISNNFATSFAVLVVLFVGLMIFFLIGTLLSPIISLPLSNLIVNSVSIAISTIVVYSLYATIRSNSGESPSSQTEEASETTNASQEENQG